jgi:hypothetical protein
LRRSQRQASDRRATADVQRLARDEAGFTIGKERHGTRDILGPAQPADRDRCASAARFGLSFGSTPSNISVSSIGPGATTLTVTPCGASSSAQVRAGRACRPSSMHTRCASRARAPRATDQHDAAEMRATHRRQICLYEHERRGEVKVCQRVEIRDVDLVERLFADRARVVHDRRDGMLTRNLFGCLARRAGIAQVDRHGSQPRGLDPGLASRKADHVVTLIEQRTADRDADAVLPPVTIAVDVVIVVDLSTGGQLAFEHLRFSA